MILAHKDLITLIQTDWTPANTDNLTPDDFVVAEEHDFADPSRERILGMSRGGMRQRKKDLTYSTITREFPVAVEVYTRVSAAHNTNMTTEVRRILDLYRKGFTVGSNNYSQMDIEREIPASIPRAGVYIHVFEIFVQIFMKDIG